VRSPAIFWVETVLLEPVLDVPSPDDYLPTYAVIGDAVDRVVQKLKSLRLSDTEAGLELTTRQHVSFAGRPISFFVYAHTHLLCGFSSLPMKAQP